MKSIRVRDLIIGEGYPKICVPIIDRNGDELLNNSDLISNLNADMYEFRGDYSLEENNEDIVMNMLKDVRMLIKNKPLMFTLRSKEEGGTVSLSLEKYLNLNLKVIESGLADIVDVELQKGPETINRLAFEAHENGRFLLLSKHYFSKMPHREEMLSEFINMRDYPSDIIKIAVSIGNERDLLNLFHVSLTIKDELADRPFALIGMGGKGMLSRVTGKIFGSSMTFAKGSEASAPGQIEVTKVRKMMDIINEGYHRK